MYGTMHGDTGMYTKAYSKVFFPLETILVGAPKGGSLYFIDTPGAMVALPSRIFGPPSPT